MATRSGGTDRISTKAKLAGELAVLGELLVHVRESHKLKQGEVAAKLGLPPSYLSKVEKGTRRLDVIEFLQIVEAIGAEPDEVIRELQEALRSDPAVP